MTKTVPTKPITRSEARLYAAKAEEHLDAALESLQSERWTAAATLAAHAGINAVDAITGMALGRRSSGEQHEQVLVLLKQIPSAGDARKHLSHLLAIKPKAEYDAKPIRKTAAAQAVGRAEKLLEIARSIAADL